MLPIPRSLCAALVLLMCEAAALELITEHTLWCRVCRTQASGGIKKIASRLNPLQPLAVEPLPLQPYDSTPQGPPARM